MLPHGLEKSVRPRGSESTKQDRYTREDRAEAAAEKLRERVRTEVQVLRDGVPRMISVEELVSGDVVLLSAGSIVPADGVLLDATDC